MEDTCSMTFVCVCGEPGNVGAYQAGLQNIIEEVAFDYILKGRKNQRDFPPGSRALLWTNSYWCLFGPQPSHP